MSKTTNTAPKEAQAVDTVFKTVTQVQKLSGLSEYHIREDIRTGFAPCITCGNKFMIDYQTYIDRLRAQAGARRSVEGRPIDGEERAIAD